MTKKPNGKRCIVCGKALVGRQAKCCSNSCRASYTNSISTGEKARNYKGGKSIHTDGYVRVYMPDHPRACSAGYVYEHILVMEQHLGRPLASDEIVHHKNGNKSDNRIENLEVSTQAEHCKLHNKQRKNANSEEDLPFI